MTNEIVKMLLLIKLVIVMSATNAVSKPSFSAMRRLCTYLRTNIASSRLNNAMMLHTHKTGLDKLSVVDAKNDFVFEIDHRNNLFR